LLISCSIPICGDFNSEKQLREFTATYSVDNRIDVVKWFLGLFKKDEDAVAAAPAAAAPSYEKSLVRSYITSYDHLLLCTCPTPPKSEYILSPFPSFFSN
jgi:hypothetical protein